MKRLVLSDSLRVLEGTRKDALLAANEEHDPALKRPWLEDAANLQDMIEREKLDLLAVEAELRELGEID